MDSNSTGNPTLLKEVSREMWGFNWLDTLMQDLRYALRTMKKSPGFTFVAVLSLTLGIGANTAIFSLVDAALLRMLPVHKPEEIFIVAHSGKRPPSSSSNYPLYEFLRDRLQSFSGMCTYWPMDVKIRTDSGAEPASAQFVSANYFSVLGVQPALGRTFGPADEREAVAVISYVYWERKFARDPGVLGKTLVVNGTPLTIIGVTAPEFFGLQMGSPIEVSILLSIQPRLLPEYGDRLTARDGWWNLWILGRLKPGVPAERAHAEVDVLFRQWISELKLPDDMTKGSFVRADLLPGSNGLNMLRRRFSKPLRVLMAIVGLVLLIACANIANLLTARSAARRREIAIRLAVGAGRARLIRQLLTESLLLAAIGGAAGVLLAWHGSNFLVSLISTGAIPVHLDLGPDPRILTFTAAVSLLTGLLFGLAPALQATSPRLRVAPSPRHPLALSRLMVVSQVALSLFLLIGATLFVLSLRNIKALDAGFRTEGLLLVTFDPDGTGYRGERLAAFYREAVERVSRIPGVRAASMSSLGPLSTDDNTRLASVPGFTPRSIEDQVIHHNSIAPQFFETMGIPVLGGREFTSRDDASAAKVALINETAARFYFRDTDPLGKTINIGRPPGPPLEIVGVVKDSKRSDLREPPPRMIYVPFPQYLQPYMTFEIRTAGNPAALAPAVRTTLLAFNRDIPIRQIHTARMQIDSTLVQEKLVATLSGFFGFLALLLCSVGLYGLMAYTVARRTTEIGIRMALGASPGQVLWLVLREAGLLVLFGSVAGVSAAAAVNRIIANMLYGLTPADPAAFTLASLILLAVAAVAAWLPAKRASRVDPMVALRYE